MSDMPQVLIVGAGPTGLVMACCLLREKVPFRLIDRRSEATQTSNALGIQSRTVELLADLGLADRFLQQGKKLSYANMHANGKHLARLDLTHLPSKFPFILSVPQCVTELILIEYLKEHDVQIERGTTLTELEQTEHHVEVSLTHCNASCENTKFEWVIGCDGAHSTVRELCGTPFTGEDIEQRFVVADVKFKENGLHDEIHSFFTGEGVLVLFPMKGGRCRVIANLSRQDHKDISDADIQDLVEKRTNGLFKQESVGWLSPFWIHSKTIKHMRDKHVFFAGDAAHIHSPVGGQGMNTGMQDVYNLSWKLAAVMNDKVNEKLLDSYDLERRPVISSLVASTEKMTKIMLVQNPILQNLRNCFAKVAVNTKLVNRKLALQISQLGIVYKNSPIINYSSSVSSAVASPGSKLLNVKLENGEYLIDSTKGREFSVLFLTGQNDEAKANIEFFLKKMTALTRSTNIVVVTPNSGDYKCNRVIEDKSLVAHKALRCTAPSVYIVRPDSYIAYASKLESAQWPAILLALNVNSL